MSLVRLTWRHEQIRDYLLEGHTMREAAAQFGVSLSTCSEIMKLSGYQAKVATIWEPVDEC